MHKKRNAVIFLCNLYIAAKISYHSKDTNARGLYTAAFSTAALGEGTGSLTSAASTTSHQGSPSGGAGAPLRVPSCADVGAKPPAQLSRSGTAWLRAAPEGDWPC